MAREQRLTAAQQDYLEIIYRLQQHESKHPTVRITDIARELGTRLPTVSRTIKRLSDLGLVIHEIRGHVELSPAGRQVAADVVHRHDDLVRFFTRILGVSPRAAEADACQIEHGISARTAQRLHEFLLFFNNLPRSEQRIITRFQRLASGGKASFRHIPTGKTTGWRS